MGRRKMGSGSGFLSSSDNIMGKLQVLARKYLDKDVKVLVKHKMLDNTLGVTDEGLEFLAAFLFSKHKTELAEELRTQKKEEKEEEESEEKKKK